PLRSSCRILYHRSCHWIAIRASTYGMAGDEPISPATHVPVSDLNIRRLAHLFIHLDGEQAIAKARKMVEEMRRKGDHDGADKWRPISVAIGEFGEPPTEARH